MTENKKPRAETASAKPAPQSTPEKPDGWDKCRTLSLYRHEDGKSFLPREEFILVYGVDPEGRTDAYTKWLLANRSAIAQTRKLTARPYAECWSERRRIDNLAREVYRVVRHSVMAEKDAFTAIVLRKDDADLVRARLAQVRKEEAQRKEG